MLHIIWAQCCIIDLCDLLMAVMSLHCMTKVCRLQLSEKLSKNGKPVFYNNWLWTYFSYASSCVVRRVRVILWISC